MKSDRQPTSPRADESTTDLKYKMDDDLVDTLPGPEINTMPNQTLTVQRSTATLAPTVCPDPNDYGTLSVIEETKTILDPGIGYEPKRYDSDLTSLNLKELTKMAEDLNID